jgi:phosphoenolpyruvate carboxykinase (GTP)
MTETGMEILRKRLSGENLDKLVRINNPELHRFVADYIELCEPKDVFVCSDTPEELAYIRDQAVKAGEEKPLKIKGHTIHFDHYNDQGRDKANTKILVSKMVDFGLDLNATDTAAATDEVRQLLKGMMKNATMYVRFFTLGPRNSVFSIPCAQLTDSAYVAHSEDLLYRQAYSEFVRLGKNPGFLKFVHSQGELENGVCKNLKLRRIYIDLEDEIVYSINTQYGGNTIGLKKLALRFAIQRADREGWLAEHMFLMGVHGPKSRVTYFTGAFPSMCGKTSTSMMKGETIVGDDIAYLRIIDGKVRAVNVEKGIFGIIQGVNSVDDPILWNAFKNPGEIIFSNVLYTPEGVPHWIGKDAPTPAKGINHSGEWTLDKVDAKGKKIPASHPNARVTLELKLLNNLDPGLDDPKGLDLGGVIYGGRDSDTWPPVEESFDWIHGVITKGAALESETTAATLGTEGIREFNPMANIDFLSIPIGKYLSSYLEFGKKLAAPPKIFSVNYFLRDKQDNWLNQKTDKAVWLKWMELRVNNDVEAIRTPTGLIPKFEDLKKLFKSTLGRDYTLEAYNQQFSLRVHEYITKMNRIQEIYRMIKDSPAIISQTIEAQRDRLIAAKEKHGEVILPEVFLKNS